MKRYIIATIIILAVVGCAANGVVQQALRDAGGSMVWKALAAVANVQSDSANDDSVARYDGTDGHLVQKSNIYVDDTDHLGVNATSSSAIAARLHVRESGSSMLCPSNSVLALQNNNASATDCLSAFCSGSAGKSILYFGNSSDYSRGLLEFDCATDDLRLWATDDVKIEGDNVHVDCGDIYASGHLRVEEGMRVNRTAVASSLYSVAATDYYLGVTYTTTGAVTITLPSASTAGAGRMLLVIDEGGNASARNISFAASGGDSIRGTSTISTDYGTRRFTTDGGSQWFAY